MVFEIVKAKSEKPEELLVGEGVLEVLPMDLDFCAPLTITIYLLQKTFMSLQLKSVALI